MTHKTIGYDIFVHKHTVESRSELLNAIQTIGPAVQHDRYRPTTVPICHTSLVEGVLP